jgi:hypothetical protein
MIVVDRRPDVMAVRAPSYRDEIAALSAKGFQTGVKGKER